MRVERSTVVGLLVVVAYAALVGYAAVTGATGDSDRPAIEETDAAEAAEALVAAWERSRTATFVTTGTYERRSDVTGAAIRSEDHLAQRPPRRLHRQLGGVE